MHVYTREQGEQLVKAARATIELYLSNPHFNKDTIKETLHEFSKQYGIFVTLEHYPTRELRGCVGFPRAVYPIAELLVDSAVMAAFEDPRFVSVSKPELTHLLIEISILSDPVRVMGNEKKRLESVKVGRDGLMIEYGLHSGLLLPIVAVDNKWTKKKFLEETCIKAGLHTNYWSQPNVKLYKFESQVFREQEPEGKVIEVKLDKA